MRVVAGVMAFFIAAAAAFAGPDSPRGLALDVEVVAEDGRPVAGARVDAFETRPWIAEGVALDVGIAFGLGPEAAFDELIDPNRQPRKPDVSAKSGADGRAHVEGLSPRRWTLVVAAPGRVVERRTVIVAGCQDPLRFVVSEGNRLEGRILDQKGRPVSGALVVASYDGLDSLGPAVSPFDPFTRSDADGVYRFDALPEGAIYLHAAPSGVWSPRNINLRLPDVRRLDVEIPRYGPISGVVRDVGTGNPVPGAVVYLEERESGTRTRVVADASGRYVVPYWPAASIGDVSARAEHHCRVKRTVWTETKLNDAGPTQIDCSVRAGGTLHGRVLCQGRPVPDAWVKIRSLESRSLVVRTDARGNYASPVLPPMSATLDAFRCECSSAEFNQTFEWAKANGDAAAGAWLDIPELGEARYDFELPPPPKSRLVGVVVDAVGYPVRSANVLASNGHEVQVDRDGFFAVRDVGDKSVSLAVGAKTFRPTRVESVRADGSADSRPLVVRLARDRMVRVRGVVRTAAGAPVVRAAVRAQTWKKSGDPDSSWRDDPYCLYMRRDELTGLGTDGMFDISVPAGTDDEIVFAAIAPGHAPQIRRLMDTGDGAAPITIEIQLAVGATIRGRVVSGATKAPLVGASILIESPPRIRTRGFWPVVYASTDDVGSFVIHDLPPGKIQISANAAAFGTDIRTIDVAQGAATITADFALPAWGESSYEKETK